METAHGSGLRGDLDPTQRMAVSGLSYPAGYGANLLKALKEQRDRQDFCDLILEVQGSQFYAHRNIIGAWSPCLLSQLERTTVQREMARVNFEDPQVFGQLLEFMYSGYVNLQTHSIVQMLHLACSFQVSALRELCERWLVDQLGVGNLMSSFRLACRYRLAGLEAQCVTQLQHWLSETVKQHDFLALTPSQVNSFLASRLVSTVSPEVKLFLIISWLGYDVREREQFLVMLLKHIDWSSVAQDFLQEISQTENFFTSNESSLYLLLQTLHSSGISLGPYESAFPSLRQKHSFLLNQVVQGSILPPSLEDEEFHPVSVSICVQWTSQASKDVADKCLQTEPDNSEVSEGAVQDETSAVAPSERNFLSEGELDGEGLDSTAVEEEEALTASVLDPHPSPMSSAPKSPLNSPCVKSKGRKKGRPRKIPPLKLRKTEVGVRRSSGRGTWTKEKRKRSAPSSVPQQSDAVSDDANSEPSVPVKKSALESNSKPSVNSLEMAKSIVPKEGRQRGRPRKKLEMHHCDSCEFYAVSADRLLKHKRRFHESGQQYHCSLCDVTFQWNKKYYLHMRTHFSGPPFQCESPGCQYSAERIQTLLNHRVKHSDQRPFPCPKCDLRFRTKPNLHAHLKCHTGARPFECSVCQRAFATKNTAEQHMVTHSDHRPYLCDTCGFSTKFQSHLIAHKRIHTGEVFRCQFPQCTYFTPKRSQLKAHMRSHLGIRRHVCSTCGKAFVEKSHLVRHERLHTDDKPYQCTLCDYASTRVDKLKEHVEKHHGETTSSPPSKQVKSKARRRRARPDPGPPTQVALTHPPAPLPPPSGEGTLRPPNYYLEEKPGLFPSSSSAAELGPGLPVTIATPVVASSGMDLQAGLRDRALGARELTVLQAALSTGPTTSAPQAQDVAIDNGTGYILTSTPASSAPGQQETQEFGLQTFMTMIPHFEP